MYHWSSLCLDLDEWHFFGRWILTSQNNIPPSKIEWDRIPTDPGPSKRFFFFRGSLISNKPCWRFLGIPVDCHWGASLHMGWQCHTLALLSCEVCPATGGVCAARCPFRDGRWNVEMVKKRCLALGGCGIFMDFPVFSSEILVEFGLNIKFLECVLLWHISQTHTFSYG